MTSGREAEPQAQFSDGSGPPDRVARAVLHINGLGDLIVSRSTRTRLVAASGALVLTALALTACGSDDGSGADTGGGLDAVKITGDVGKAPKVEWEGEVAPQDIETEVVTEGDGEVIEAGDGALAHIWIGNGFTEEEAYNSYDTKAPQLLIGEISEPFKKALEGHTVGSRVAVAANATDAFGETGNSQLGIGNKDGLVFVVDLMARVGDEPPARSARRPSGPRASWRATASSPDSTSPRPTSPARTSSTPR